MIAVEPDEGNFRLLQKNLEPFGERARALQAAVWSRDQRLRIDRGHFGDGKEWSYQVRVCRDDERVDVTALSLETVLNQFNLERVDLMKIDVERAELELFTSGYVPWLSRTRNLAIELHDPDCGTGLGGLRLSGAAVRRNDDLPKHPCTDRSPCAANRDDAIGSREGKRVFDELLR